MVVDGEWVFREFEAQALHDLGCTVFKSQSPEAALVWAKARARAKMKVHLLLAGLEGSRVDGVEFARRFRALHPECACLIVAGASPVMHGEIGVPGWFGMLARPFTEGEMTQKVPALLADKGPLPLKRASAAADARNGRPKNS